MPPEEIDGRVRQDVDPGDPVGRRLSRPHFPVGTGRDTGQAVQAETLWTAGGILKFGDVSRDADASDSIAHGLGKPDVPVRPRRDVLRAGEDAKVDAPASQILVVGAGNRKLSHVSARRDSPNLVRHQLGEPHVAVRAAADPRGLGTNGQGKFRDDAPGRDAADPRLLGRVAGDGIAGDPSREHGIPDVAVGTGSNACGVAPAVGSEKLGNDTAGADPTNLVAALLCEPEIAIGAHGNPEWITVSRRDGEL